MVKPRTIFVSMIVLLAVFAGYLFIGSLEPPSHIHSRDDVPAGGQDQNAQLTATIQKLEKQLQEDPNNFQLIMHLGHAYLDAEQHEKAVAIFTRAIKIDPQNAEAHTDLGVSLRKAGKLMEALQILEAVTRDFPDYSDGWLQLGALYRFELNENQKALVCFQKYLELEPQSQLGPRVKREIEQIQKEMN